MGQARIRGTKEQRVEQAIEASCERREQEAIEQATRDEAEALRVANMTPEEREAHNKRIRFHREKMMGIATFLALAGRR